MRTAFANIIAVGLASAILTVSLAFVPACNYTPAPNGAYDAANPDDCLPAVPLVDQNGTHVSLAALKGKPVLVDFIYTSCPGPCSVLTSKLVGVAKDLGPKLGAQVRMVSISLDPENDTPKKLKDYADRLGAQTSGWLFLTGTPQQVDQVLATYKLRRLREADGSVSHMETMFLLGPDGRQRRIYNGVEVQAGLLSAEAEQLAARG
jgi:protein SCO1/2